jgi:hypothetical protein
MFALPLDDEEIELYRQATGRDNPPEDEAREWWVVVNRRGGKSFVMSILAAYAATVREYPLAPGERGVVMLIASDRAQARVLRRYIGALFEQVPMLGQLVDSETRDAICLTNGIDLEIHTASFRSVRGYAVVAAILDEIAFWPADDSADPDKEIIAALRPAMATVGGKLVAISSPYGRRGQLWAMHERYFGKAGDVLVWKSGGRVMNPSLDPAVIDRAFTEDSVSAWSEFGRDGEIRFRSDIETYVSREVIEGCVVAGRREIAPILHKGRSIGYRAFVDPSGGSGTDSMTLAIGHATRDATPYAVLDCMRERKPPFSPEEVVKEFAGVLESYGIQRVIGDRYAGSWPAEAFKRHGIVYEPAMKAKSDLYKDALAALNAGRVELLDNDRLINQLLGLERRTARGGRDSIDHGPGGHDDLANVVAGLVVALVVDRGRPRKRAGVWGRGRTAEEPAKPRRVIGQFRPHRNAKWEPIFEDDAPWPARGMRRLHTRPVGSKGDHS